MKKQNHRLSVCPNHSTTYTEGKDETHQLQKWFRLVFLLVSCFPLLGQDKDSLYKFQYGKEY